MLAESSCLLGCTPRLGDPQRFHTNNRHDRTSFLQSAQACFPAWSNIARL
jgi:hypothetical protein